MNKNKTYNYDVFISYSRKDKEDAQHLATKLKEFGFHTWHTGEEFISEQIVDAMEDSAVCILLFGPDGNSPWADEYVWSAIRDRCERTYGAFRVIFVLLPGVTGRELETVPACHEMRLLPQKLGAFVRFEKSLEEKDTIRHLIFKIRGVPSDEESIWGNPLFRDQVRCRAKNALNVDWTKLWASPIEAGIATSMPNAPTLMEVPAEADIPEGSESAGSLTDSMPNTFVPDYGNFFAWTQTIVRNMLFSARREIDSHFDNGPVEVYPSIPDSRLSPEEQLLIAEEQPLIAEEQPLSRELEKQIWEVVESTNKPIDALLEDPEFQRRGFMICCGLAPNREIAEELFQAVSLKVWLNVTDHFVPDYGKPYGNFFTWFQTIARNTLFSARREIDSHFDADPIDDHLSIVDPNPNPEEQLLRRDLGKRIWVHVKSLPTNHRLATTLFLKGYSSRQSVETLNRLGIKCSHGTVLEWVNKSIKPFFQDGVSPVKKVREMGLKGTQLK